MVDACDIVVVGAGPAGLAAAEAAASQGKRVVLIDSQPRAGGQVWRHDVLHGQPRVATDAIRDVAGNANVTCLEGTQVVAVEPGRLLLQDAQRGFHLAYGALVLATGARELLLPFPGWTLPGVTGAGGLQALAKQGWPLRGKRVLIAGSGPLLLAAAATAQRHGAHVVGIHEQAGASAVHRFAAGLWRWPGKLAQAARLRLELARVPYRTGSIVSAAEGEHGVSGARVRGRQGDERIACDLLAVGYGLLPQVELAQLLGCALEPEGAHARVQVGPWQATSQPRVFAAGEACGIGGLDCARVEGRIAGLAAAGAPVPPTLVQRRDRARAFAASLREHFTVRDDVRGLANGDTTICRCEDVPLGAVRPHADTREAKLATRCGMGACQGRICGSALAELGHGPRGGTRPPLFPARLATLGEPVLSSVSDTRGYTS
jgi:NADPH-dependent 2,4-dienoyl-CoA reductase/sulfur reductase-like enzyme